MLIMHSFFKCQAALLGLLASLAAPDPVADEPPEHPGDEAEVESETLGARAPKGFSVEKISYNGSGCPNEGDVTVDKKSFRAVYHKMILKNPPGPPLKSKDCIVSISLRIPPGWQFAPAKMGLRGRADLDKGVSARQTSAYFFAGDPVSSAHKTELRGKYDDEYVHVETVPEHELVWSPCGEPAIFAFDSYLQLNATKNLDGKAEVRVMAHKIAAWRWRKC